MDLFEVEPFVVTVIQGGLGNQLFQYFAACKLAQAQGGKVCLHTDFFATQGKRSYRLADYNIPQRRSTTLQWCLMRLTNARRTRRLWRALTSWLPSWQFLLIDEEERSLESVPGTGQSLWLLGYWQNLKNLEGLESLISSSLRLKRGLGEEAAEWRRRIVEENAVCVHVRRGDYASEAHTNQVHGLCEPSYFQRAMQRLAAELEDCHFFIFSDEPAWAAEHVAGFGVSTVVDFASEDRRDIEDFELMRACRHFIISNSTFSWWPAWLGTAPDKKVIAPARWFADGRKVALIPSDWIQM